MEKFIMILTNAAYILAITFQLSAAWILVGNTSVTRDGLIKAFCANHKGGIPFDKNGRLLNRSAWESTVTTAWTNRIAFIFLGIGYLLNILGSCTMKKEWALIIVIVLSAIFVVIPTEYAKRKSKKIEKPCLDEIPLVDGVQINIVGDEEFQKEDMLK